MMPSMCCCPRNEGASRRGCIETGSVVASPLDACDPIVRLPGGHSQGTSHGRIVGARLASRLMVRRYIFNKFRSGYPQRFGKFRQYSELYFMMGIFPDTTYRTKW